MCCLLFVTVFHTYALAHNALSSHSIQHFKCTQYDYNSPYICRQLVSQSVNQSDTDTDTGSDRLTSWQAKAKQSQAKQSDAKQAAGWMRWSVIWWRRWRRRRKSSCAHNPHKYVHTLCRLLLCICNAMQCNAYMLPWCLRIDRLLKATDDTRMCVVLFSHCYVLRAN